MNIAVLSDTRLPTLPDGPHGLGRSAHEIATGLAGRGHTVTLFAAPGSGFEAGRLVTHGDEQGRAHWLAQGETADYDAILDTSHHHLLSRLRPDWPVLNRVCDREATYTPPNAVVNSTYMQNCYPAARLVNTGIDTAAIPFFPEPSYPLYLAFGGSPYDGQRGYEIAERVAKAAGLPLKVATNLTSQEKWQWLGGALALLYPSTNRAAPRLPLEAAACGVPTLCLAGDGCQYHVWPGVTGYACRDDVDMSGGVQDVATLDRPAIREWVAYRHDYAVMVAEYRELLTAVANGERW